MNYVKCHLCQKNLLEIDFKHLLKCSEITLSEYREMFPTSKTISEDLRKTKSRVSTGVKQTKETIQKRVIGTLKNRKYKPHTTEEKIKISNSLKGRSTWSLGLTKETDKRIKNRSISMSGKSFSKQHIENLKKSHTKERRLKASITQKNNFKKPDFLEKYIKGSKACPNKTELMLINLITLLNIPYKFVGDFTLWIGGKNPDFINEKDKKIIEFFGYRHREEATNIPNIISESDRKDHFKKFGYNCLILWDEDIINEEFLKEKILTFHLSDLKI